VKPVVTATDRVTGGVETDAQASPVESVAQCTFTGAGARSSIALPIVPVMVSNDQQDIVVSTYALLDSGSINSFCSHSRWISFVSLVKSLLSITTLDKADTVSEVQSVTLQVTSVNTAASVTLPAVYVRPQMYVNGLDAVKSTDLKQWFHLCDIMFPDVSLSKDNRVPKAQDTVYTRV